MNQPLNLRVPLATRHPSSLRHRARCWPCKRQPHGVHLVKVRVEELWISFCQGQHCFLAEERGLAIELLPDVLQREVRVARKWFYLLRWCLKFRKSTMPAEDVGDLLGSHGSVWDVRDADSPQNQTCRTRM